MVVAHRQFGTTALLPTLITDTFAKMQAATAAAESLVGKNSSVLGIHLEGPFLSPEKAGAHNPNLIRTPSPSEVELLCAKRRGTLLMTLAPERVPREFLGRLVKSGVRVSLGHSMATYTETCAATAEGLTGFTHLFNAMRPLTSREPGPIARALESDDVWFGMIVDGVHVDPVMLRIALRGRGRPMLVTDAMPPVGGCRSNFYLYGREIRLLDGRCLRADGTLAGAALDMATAVRNCVNLLQVPLEDALRFASTNPAEFIGLGDVLGKLCPGHRADMVAIDPDNYHRLGNLGGGRNGGGFRTIRPQVVAPRSPPPRLSKAIFGLSLCHRLCGNFDQSSTCPNNCSSASTAAPVFAERAYGICRGTCLARAGADQRTSARIWPWRCDPFGRQAKLPVDQLVYMS